mgnify:CR=1 FL=1
MKYRLEAWTFPTDEEGGDTDLHEAGTFELKESAQEWAWDRMEEGFQCRVYRE